MARPQSLPELYPSLKARSAERRKGTPSISLAAGLIMAAESPKNSPRSPPSRRASVVPRSTNLFYAYARRSDYAQFSPYLLTFVTADIARQWWNLVQQEYPDSTREGTQLFTFKGDDIPGQIWDNQKFEHLRNKWFYSHFGDMSGTGGIIPLQDEHGNLIGKQAEAAEDAKFLSNGHIESPDMKNFDFSALQDNMEKMHSMIQDNTNQIKALSVAQSEGLQRMQEINESNALQIKALADGQAQLQAMVDKNSSQFIALTNSQFQNQEQIKDVLQQNADTVRYLAEGQDRLGSVCRDMMGAVAQLSQTFSQTLSSPPPRKLNKRVMAYTYESGAVSVLNSVNGVTPPITPRK